MTSSIPWEKTIRNLLDNEVTDFGNLSSLLVDLFEGVVMPDIFLTHANKVAVQQIFSVRVSTLINFDALCLILSTQSNLLP